LRYRYELGLTLCDIRLGVEFSSHPGHIHGGLVATLFDEVMGHAAYRSSGRPMVTTLLRVRFIEPLAPETDYRLEVKVEAGADGWVNVNGELHHDSMVAAASASFRPLGGA